MEDRIVSVPLTGGGKKRERKQRKKGKTGKKVKGKKGKERKKENPPIDENVNY